ncbi:MAG: hypothetical protein IKH42_05175, partial [Lachnospiraceae bacterium]|nr:hypothetical protein [Lachnospiraceae bacterium]
MRKVRCKWGICSLLLAVVMVLALAGCSGSKSSVPKTMPSPDTDAGYPATPGPSIQDTTTAAPTEPPANEGDGTD